MASRKKQTSKILFTWRATQGRDCSRTVTWYVIAGIVLLALVLYGFFAGGWTFSLAVIVFAATYVITQNNIARPDDVQMVGDAIMIGGRRFPYDRIKFFWVVDEPAVCALYLRMNSKFYPDLRLPLGRENAEKVRKILSKFVTQKEDEAEPFSDVLLRLLKL